MMTVLVVVLSIVLVAWTGYAIYELIRTLYYGGSVADLFAFPTIFGAWVCAVVTVTIVFVVPICIFCR